MGTLSSYIFTNLSVNVSARLGLILAETSQVEYLPTSLLSPLSAQFGSCFNIVVSIFTGLGEQKSSLGFDSLLLSETSQLVYLQTSVKTIFSRLRLSVAETSQLV